MSDHTDGAWTLDSVKSLRTLAQERVPVSVMSLKLKRSAASVRAKLAELGLTPAAE